MSEITRKPVGDRGLGVYGEPLRDTYGKTEIVVQDSSAAMYDACWLRLEGEAHLDEDAEIIEHTPATVFQGRRIPATRLIDGDISAHLDLPRAKALRDMLGHWIMLHDDGDETNSKEGSGW